MLATMTAHGPAFASLTADDHVTGEAVALDLPPASLGSRIGSGLIDVLVTVALLIATFLFFGIAVACTATKNALRASSPGSSSCA